MTTKEAIIYESLKLFSDNGYEAVSTRMIARAVGASDAVIYKHFKNKQETDKKPQSFQKDKSNPRTYRQLDKEESQR